MSRVKGAKESSKFAKKAEVLYNDIFGFEMLQDIGVVVSKVLLNLALFDFGKVPLFKSTIKEAESRVLLRAYPFYQGCDIYRIELNQLAAFPPKGQGAIYVRHLEAGLRMPITRSFSKFSSHHSIFIAI